MQEKNPLTFQETRTIGLVLMVTTEKGIDVGRDRVEVHFLWPRDLLEDISALLECDNVF